jgi:hypothetical protein
MLLQLMPTGTFGIATREGVRWLVPANERK